MNCFNEDMTFILLYGAQCDTNAVCHETQLVSGHWDS